MSQQEMQGLASETLGKHWVLFIFPWLRHSPQYLPVKGGKVYFASRFIRVSVDNWLVQGRVTLWRSWDESYSHQDSQEAERRSRKRSRGGRPALQGPPLVATAHPGQL